MAVIKFTNSKSSIKKIFDYITQLSKTEKQLISGKDCMPETALKEMLIVKNMYHKSIGRQYIHIVQSFNPKDNLTYQKANKIGLQLAEKFEGFQAVVATHKDRNHIHNHILINSVNFITGLKFQQSKKEMKKVKDLSDKLCIANGLSIIEKPELNTDIKRNEYQIALKGESWKIKLILTIDEAMKVSKSKVEFISNMNCLGYKVNWSDTKKYITYITPDGNKCRDNKLHNKKYLKEEMEIEFRKIKANTVRKTKQQSKSNIEFNDSNRGIRQKYKNEFRTNRNIKKESIRERLELEKAKIKCRENEKRINDVDIGISDSKYNNHFINKHDVLR